jgi:Flp pilus assembly protein TadD
MVRGGGLLLGAVAFVALAGCGDRRDGGPVTFNRHIAPLLYENCAACHRPGESAPFSLLTYRDAKKHDEQIVKVTRSGFMPPWLPEAHRQFVGERRLTEDEIDRFRAWYEGGSLEGDPDDLPPPPQWTEGWRLGEPDLVLESPETYTLPADGLDVFRSLILPIPTEEPRWVRAIELRPGNPRAIHHAILRVDTTRSSQLLDAEDEEPGYGGMRWADALPPDGRILGWTPGKAAYEGPYDLSWKLEPGSDLVVQLHMVPSGKPEPIRIRAGIHFADGPPQRLVSNFVLKAQRIDIPAGERDYVAEDSYELPVDLQVLSIYPHAHYLGKVMEAYARLPDGTQEWLVRIPQWDFNWQDQYHYAEPVFLPAGSTVFMRYTYDNSAENPRNPSVPPRRVKWGDRSSDEMGTLALEVSPQSEKDLALLRESFLRQDLRKHPDYAHGYGMLGAHLLAQGDFAGAARHLMRALELLPDSEVEHNNLGKAWIELGQPDRARRHFERALELRPDYPDALYNMGVMLAEEGRMDEAVALYRRALEVRPHDAETHNNLAIALAMRGEPDQALQHFRRAVELDPRQVEAVTNLGNALLSRGQVEEAIAMYRRALELDPASENVRHNLQTAERMRPGAGTGP